MSQFDNGASRFKTKSNLEKYGIGQGDGTSFVLPKHQADSILSEANGSKRAIEKSLGLPQDFLEGVIDVNKITINQYLYRHLTF